MKLMRRRRKKPPKRCQLGGCVNPIKGDGHIIRANVMGQDVELLICDKHYYVLSPPKDFSHYSSYLYEPKGGRDG